MKHFCKDCFIIDTGRITEATKFYRINNNFIQPACETCFDCMRDLFTDYGCIVVEHTAEEYEMDRALI